MKAYYCIILFLLNISLQHGQETPPIATYPPEIYGADNQNWSIAQTDNNFIYVANNKGLLEYNGETWQLYESPNGKTRSVNVIDNIVYTGSYREFGYWANNTLGTKNYHSISQELNIQFLEDEEFWNIISVDDWVLFQSLKRIYAWNKTNDSYFTIKSDSVIYKIFKIKETIYFQSVKEGLFKIENGKSKLVSDNTIFKNNYLVNLFSFNNEILAQTEENGFYILNSKNELNKWMIPANELLSELSIYRSSRLQDGSYVLGTRSNGIIHLSHEGELKYVLNVSNGLLNNSIHDVFEDAENNIWLALENGLNCVNINSPFSIYHDKEGQLGTVYASTIHKGLLYLGTNQGLFYKPLNSKVFKLKFIKGTEGPVWSLFNYQNTLFCGHNLGTFIINNGSIDKKIEINGTWKLTSSLKNPNILVQGNYDGLSVLENKNGNWFLRNTIDGFKVSSRFFEIQDNKIFVNHENKGVFKIAINEDFTKAISVTKEPSIDKGDYSSLVKYNNNILYSYKEGIYKYRPNEKHFIKDTIISELFKKLEFTSGKLIINNNNGNLWCFSKNKLNYISPGKLSSDLKINSIPFPETLPHALTGYENISKLSDNKFLIGTSGGFIILDLDKPRNSSYDISINSIILSDIKNNKINLLEINKDGNFINTHNNIEFNFCVPEYNKYLNTEYQYQLKGFYPNWSEWSKTPKIFFKNLPHGTYEFNVRAKIGNNLSANVSHYKFTIAKPWYLSNIMIIAYSIGAILLVFITHSFYKRYYKNQRENLMRKTARELELKELENRQQLMRFNNEKLRQDIDNKSRELGISTMSIIKKNELLSSIKKELQNIKDASQLKSVINIIDKNLNNTDDWNLFEEAFNNADKDFLKKIKSLHPELTTNDLRLCTYLRLNLSSKEIAPLLNISPRSVEVKRYRLRKKMKLAHESSLTDYILEI
ncbi:LuxR C-terminal-related transcriptional regulator [Seonamhaeicola sp. MEBiC1930]|uniref:triple tyrosine motif-containing protein n=1 Tax=Seonamhaeicola sp. MEBiC01930 TaxID=2976768 RepID=UPI0032469D25